MKPLIITSLSFILVASMPAQTVVHDLSGQSGGDKFGQSVSVVGDVNNDGYTDFIVGAPWDDTGGTNAGAARVYSGFDGSVLLSFLGNSSFDWFGWSVSGAGDVNGDGTPDCIVGAPKDDPTATDSGSATVFSGADGSVLYTFNGSSNNAQFGFSVSGAGDVNLDGFADVIIGAPHDSPSGSNSGSAWVYSGATGTQLHMFSGSMSFLQLGQSVAGAGDVDADGFADLIVGIPLASGPLGSPNNGQAKVYSGATGAVIYTVVGDTMNDSLGEAVGTVGDINDDGRDDFIVGIPFDFAGRARVYSGIDGSTLYTFTGSQNGDRFGSSVAKAGDVNGDGFPDFIVGAPREDIGGVNSGTASVFSGADGSLLRRLIETQPSRNFGTSVAGIPDLDGDGKAEVIVGAPWETVSSPGAGTVRVARIDSLLEVAAQAFIALGDTLTYSISTSPSRPGKPYVFDVSLSGDSPGVHLGPPGSRTIPLNPPYLNFTYGAVLPGIFTGFVGVLDGQGQATATFFIPPVPSLAGTVIHGAAMTLDAAVPFGVGDITDTAAQTTVVAFPAPTLSSVSPNAGPASGGTAVTLVGTDFQSGAQVTFGGNPASNVVVVDPQTITCTTPPGSPGAVAVTVVNPDTQSATLPGGFNYLPPLNITAVVPQVAAPGASVTIIGTGFDPALTLDVGGVAVTPNLAFPSLVTFTMPASGVACDGQVTITNPGGQTASHPFNPSPTISQISPASGPAAGGNQITITGSNFVNGTTVTFGSTSGTVQAVSSTTLTVLVPAGTPGTVTLTVTSPSGCTATSAYTWL